MSHPYMPQPYYLVRQSRLSAPWPAPMGAYTVGVFDDTYRNIPSYIHEDRIAGFGRDGWYEGYGAFGADAPGCMQPEQAAAMLLTLAKSATTGVIIPSNVGGLPIPKVGGKPVAQLLEEMQSVLAPLLTEGIVELANAVKSGGDVQAAFETWLEHTIYMVATHALGEFVADRANDVGAWGLLARESRKFLTGDMIQQTTALFQNICTEPVYTEAPAAVEAPTTLTSAQLAQIRRTFAAYQQQGSLLSKTAVQPITARVAAPVVKKPVVGIAQPQAKSAAAGGGTVAILGAAALALLLLRR